MKIAYLVDTSFITPRNTECSFLSDIHYLPFIIIDSEGKEYKTSDPNWSDKILIEMFKRQPKVGVKTSITPIGIIQEEIKELLKSYDYVVGIPIARKLSSQWSSFSVLEKNPIFKNKFFCLGTDNLPFSSFYRLKEFSKLAKKEKSLNMEKVKEIIKVLDKNILCTTLVFVGDLSRLIISGRLNPAIGAIGKMVGLKVALEYTPEVGLKKVGVQRSVIKLINYTVDSSIKAKSMNVSNIRAQLFEFASSPDLQNEISQLLSEKIVISRKFMKVPSVMSAHIGINCFAITIVDNKLKTKEV